MNKMTVNDDIFATKDDCNFIGEKLHTQSKEILLLESSNKTLKEFMLANKDNIKKLEVKVNSLDNLKKSKSE